MPKSLQFAKGSIVFFEGDKDENIYILQTGTILLKSTDLTTGLETSAQLHTGEFFGVKSALARMPSMETASVITDSVVVQLSLQEFEKFVSNKPHITEKMLRVFSKTLREVHKQTEIYLKQNEPITPPEEGMCTVAKAFFNTENYTSCIGVIDKIVAFKPDSPIISEMKELQNKAFVKVSEEAKPVVIETENEENPEANAVNQFNLPVFDRFTKNYKAGEIIISEYEPGETFYFIKSGRVQIVKCISGQNKSLDILKSCTFFGEMAILDKSQRSATCIARTDVSCLEFNKENFSALVLGNPQMVLQLLKVFSKRVYDQYRQLKIILIKDLPTRICDIFLMYEELTGGEEDEEKHQRKFNITVNDVASWAAISQNDARDELTKLQERGKIEIFQDYMIISNIHDCKRTVDSYYSKLEVEADSSPLRQAFKKDEQKN